MTVSFFSGRNNDHAPARQTTRTFFSSGRNNFFHIFFFRSYLERRNNGQTTVSFFSGRNWNGALPWKAPRWKFGFTNLSIGDTQEHQLGIYPEKESLCFNIT